MYKCILFVFLLMGFYTCIQLKKNYKNCAYTISANYEQRTNNTEMNDRIIYPYFLYKNQLIELVLKENINTEILLRTDSATKSILGKQTKQVITYDTIGLQIIDPIKKEYTQIDSFQIGFNVLQKGNYKDSPTGLKMNLTNNFNDTVHSNFTDTVISDEAFKYNTNYTKDKTGKDSILVKGYFLSRKNFLTIFNVEGVKNPSPTMAFAGFSATYYKENFNLSIRVENVRALTEREILICEDIYQKTRQPK